MAQVNYLQTFGKGGNTVWAGLFENRSAGENAQRTSQDGAHGVSGELEGRIDVIERINEELDRIERADPDGSKTPRLNLSADANGVAQPGPPKGNGLAPSLILDVNAHSGHPGTFNNLFLDSVDRGGANSFLEELADNFEADLDSAGADDGKRLDMTRKYLVDVQNYFNYVTYRYHITLAVCA